MVAMVVVGVLAALVGLSSWAPGALREPSGLVSVEPGRLIVDPAARGIVTLGAGYTVALYPSGFRYAKDDHVMAETVTRGAPVVALVGKVTGRDAAGHPEEDVRATLSRVHVTALEIVPGRARWAGVVSGSADGRTLIADLVWEVVLDGARVITTVTLTQRPSGLESVGGGERNEVVRGMVLPLDWRPAVTGLPPVLPARNLRLKQWWFAEQPAVTDAFTWSVGTTVGLGPSTVPRGLDLTVDGRIDLHVWSTTATISLSGLPRPRATLSS